MVPAWTALLLTTVGMTVVFGVRTMLHRRATGDSGFRHPTRASAGSPPWWSQVLLGTALVGVLASPILVLTDTLNPVPVLAHQPLAWIGTGVALSGFGVLFLAQTSMGTSWRIGVDPGERTDLVQDGLFRLVRNPIFSAMTAAMAGLTLLVPVWPQLLALACLVAGVQIQVRLIEEPYLLDVHHTTYRRYASRTGRFMPLVGRLPEHRSAPAATATGGAGRSCTTHQLGRQVNPQPAVAADESGPELYQYGAS